MDRPGTLVAIASGAKAGERSLARYMAARGFRTYLIDWGKPEKNYSRLATTYYHRLGPAGVVMETQSPASA